MAVLLGVLALGGILDKTVVASHKSSAGSATGGVVASYGKTFTGGALEGCAQLLLLLRAVFVLCARRGKRAEKVLAKAQPPQTEGR